MTSCFVFVDQAFGRHSVKDRSSGCKCSLRFFFITLFDRCNDFLEACTRHRTAASVVLATFFSLDSTFLSGLDVSQGVTPR